MPDIQAVLGSSITAAVLRDKAIELLGRRLQAAGITLAQARDAFQAKQTQYVNAWRSASTQAEKVDAFVACVRGVMTDLGLPL